MHKRIIVLPWIVSFAALLSLGCSSQPDSGATAENDSAAMAHHDAVDQDSGMSEEQLLHKSDPKGSYGSGLTLDETTRLSAILADPESYEGKTVQVSGVVQEVCPMRGCWIELAESADSQKIRVKVTDGEIVFPLSAKDEPAIIEGVVERIEMTEEENRSWQEHLAEEQGKEFDPASVTGPATIWRIRGEGARIGG